LTLIINDIDGNVNIDNMIEMIENEFLKNSYKDNINYYNYNKESIYNETEYNNSNTKGYYLIGLLNLGSTCYFNSLIQVLFHITLFRDSILNIQTSDESHNALNELIIIFYSLKNNKLDKEYNPISFFDNCDNEILDINIQRDVH